MFGPDCGRSGRVGEAVVPLRTAADDSVVQGFGLPGVGIYTPASGSTTFKLILQISNRIKIKIDNAPFLTITKLRFKNIFPQIPVPC